MHMGVNRIECLNHGLKMHRPHAHGGEPIDSTPLVKAGDIVPMHMGVNPTTARSTCRPG